MSYLFLYYEYKQRRMTMKKILLAITIGLVGCCDFPDLSDEAISAKIKADTVKIHKPDFKQEKSEYPDVNIKYNMSRGEFSPGMDMNKNMRMNFSTGEIEFGMRVGNMWMSF